MTLELIEAARLLKFDPANGWPETFTHDRLAKLQSWRKGMESKDWSTETATWRKLIELALTFGAIDHTTTIERVQTTPPLRRVNSAYLASHEWMERGFETSRSTYATPARYKEVPCHHITAPTFAAWLAVQRMEPSAHVAAWFNAYGAACPAPSQTAALPKPILEKSASDAPVDGITTAQVAAIFDGLHYTAENWPKRLSDTKWPKAAQVALGAAGGATSLWCPATLARLIHSREQGTAKQKTLEALNRKFKSNPALEPWRTDWDEHFAMFNDADGTY